MALRAYKLCISPYFRGSCRFLPSCADYAAEAIERHGILRGGSLAARRLTRCHPLCAAGLDPVPVRTSATRVEPAGPARPVRPARAVRDVVQDSGPAETARAFSPANPAGLKACAPK